jgi:hypothetical protein
VLLPPKRLIALETLIPPPPASIFTAAQRSFDSGTRRSTLVLLSNAGLSVRVAIEKDMPDLILSLQRPVEAFSCCQYALF